MLKNLIKIAFRNILKDIGYSSLNILGLTLGIASAIFLIIYISDEVSYDRYHENSDRIYRITSHFTETDDDFSWPVTQVPFARQVIADYPEVESATQFYALDRQLFKYEDKKFFEKRFFMADSNAFEIFDYKFIYGSAENALKEPNTIILTRDAAKRYFGNEDPVGKSLERVGRSSVFKVTGVIENIPQNSHFRYDGMISRSTYSSDFGNWGSFFITSYVMLRQGVDHKQFEIKIREMYDKYMASIFKPLNTQIEYLLEPIEDIHLKSTSAMETEPTGSYAYVLIFALVAFFLILIAAMNYMNLATARSTKRAREVGLRKVVGANKTGLIFQFLTESTILTIISLIFSFIVVSLLFPQFNQLSGKSFDISILYSPTILISFIVIIIVVGILGGSYPAFYLSRFNPVVIFKGKVTKGNASSVFRRILVVIQFSISVAMIVSTLVVFKQLNHLKTKELGYNMDQIIRMRFADYRASTKYPVLKQAILKNPNVKNVTNTSVDVGNKSGKVIFNVETNDGMDQRGINYARVDHDFIETLGIEMVEGRDFQEDIPGDTLKGVIVNETMVKRFNWDKPIGKKVQLEDRSWMAIDATVIGVMKDYHQTGMYNEIETFMLVYRPINTIVYVKLKAKDIKKTIAEIEQAWNEIYPEKPFEYSFLSENFEKQFRADEKRGSIFTLFTCLAIFIACLGLLGLTSYTVERRTKEIGIRKVVGASEGIIVRLISKEFIYLVIISIAIAFPLSYYFMNSWLQNFVYRTHIGSFVFIIAALITIGITFITISYQAWRAAISNPSNSLRAE